MHIPSIDLNLTGADVRICDALETVRRLSDNGTWQGCAETSEVEVCRLRADLLELRSQVQQIQVRYGFTYREPVAGWPSYDPDGSHRAHGDVYRDGGWEDVDGFPIPPTTAPDCDRTCLSCQGGDHEGCAMGCHDAEDN